MDFEFLYPDIDPDVFLKTVPDFTTNMIAHVFPTLIKRKVKPVAHRILRKLIRNMNKGNDTDTFETSMCVTFYLLHEMFTYTQRKNTTAPPKKRKRQSEESSTSGSSRFTAADSQLAFLRFHATADDYKSAFNQMMKDDKSLAPMINVIGDMFGPKQYMIDFDNIRYCPTKITKAIDICFKCYFVFGMEYPPACVPFYQFLNSFFYKITEAETKPIPVHKSVTKLIEIAKGTHMSAYPFRFFFLVLVLVNGLIFTSL